MVAFARGVVEKEARCWPRSERSGDVVVADDVKGVDRRVGAGSRSRRVKSWNAIVGVVMCVVWIGPD